MKYLLALLLLCSSTLYAEEKATQICAVLALTGPAASHGNAILKGAELAIAELNGAGHHLLLTVDDDGTDSTRTVSAVRARLAQGCRLFIGPTWSWQIRSAAPILASADALAMVPGGSSDVNGIAQSNILNLSGKRIDNVPRLAAWLTAQKIARVFIMAPPGDDWSEVHKKVFALAAERAGAKVIGSGNFDYGADTTALKALMLKAKSLHADAILSTASVAELLTIAQLKRSFKIDAKLLFGYDIFDDEAKSLGLTNSDNHNDLYVLRVKAPHGAFAKKFFDKYHELSRYPSGAGYDAVHLLALAITKVGKEPHAIADFLHAQKGYAGVSGGITFAPNGDILTQEYEIAPLQ